MAGKKLVLSMEALAKALKVTSNLLEGYIPPTVNSTVAHQLHRNYRLIQLAKEQLYVPHNR